MLVHHEVMVPVTDGKLDLAHGSRFSTPSSTASRQAVIIKVMASNSSRWMLQNWVILVARAERLLALGFRLSQNSKARRT